MRIHLSATYIVVLLFIGFSMATCSKSNDQREFEREANSQPDKITETDDQGNIISTDSDDWRISPMYRGLVVVGTPDEQPPYPNPLSYNQDLKINLYIRNIETLNQIEVFIFENVNERPNGPYSPINDISSPTLETINLSGQIISGSTGGSQASGLYRILIYDGQQNVITYGDIRIE